MSGKKRYIFAVLLGFLSGGVALADSAPEPNPFSRYADPDGVVLAVETPFGEMRGNVRLSVYADKDSFLEKADAKHEAAVNAEGLAIVHLKKAITLSSPIMMKMATVF